MTWQLVAVGLYRKSNGELRPIRFRKSRLNIISGDSARGKSALLDIVDYCLLSKNCPIAKGVIRDCVSHVGIVIENAEQRMAIIRPLPEEGRISTGQIYLDKGPKVDLPETPPECSWNLETARDRLSEFTGIELLATLTNFNSDNPEERFVTSIRHCTPYLFQPQDVIASRNITFPIAEASFKRRHVIDAVGYFLGVMDGQHLSKVRELRELRIERNRIHREHDEQAQLKANGYERGLSLWRDARALGLLETGPDPTNLPDLLQGLSALAAARRPELQTIMQLPDVVPEQKREAELRKHLLHTRDELLEIERFVVSATRGKTATLTQLGKLRLRELLPNTNGTKSCPFCGAQTAQHEKMEQEIKKAIASLEAMSDAPPRLMTRLNDRKIQLQETEQRIEKELDDVRKRIETVVVQVNRNHNIVERTRTADQLLGRVREYAASVQIPESALETNLKALNKRIEELERQVGEGTTRKSLQSIQDKISHKMTSLTPELEVEFEDAPVRINFEELRIEVAIEKDKGRWTPLNELGSGANWLSYHLIAIIALHDHFQRVDSPVPRLVMLDQPSQVWFPPQAARPGQKMPDKATDILAVTQVYELLRKTTQDNGSQIIVVDHAYLEEPWFEEHLVEEWRGDRALVPPAWKKG